MEVKVTVKAKRIEKKVEEEEELVAAEEQVMEPEQNIFPVTPPPLNIASLPDKVKIQVVVGTLAWGTEDVHEKGEIVEVSRERLERFDPKDFKIVG